MKDNYIKIGKIVGAHGIRGLVKIISFAENPEKIFKYDLLIDPDFKPVKITKKFNQKDNFITSIDNLNDRNQAELLTNKFLYITIDQLEALPEDEFYYKDLVGLNVINQANIHIGKIVEIVNFGAGDILEVKVPDVKETMYIPFGKNVAEINIKEGFIKVLEEQDIEEE